MEQRFTVGVVLTLLGLLGYSLGVVASYPGRSFSITALMVGVTLVAISDRSEGET